MKKAIVLFLFLQMLVVSAFAQQYKYHIVKQGETTREIARKYNVSEEIIFRLNPDARNSIRANDKLVVPVGGNVENVPQVATGLSNVKFEMHRVKRQETLFSLSQQYNVGIEDIKKYNKHLYAEELKRGERVRIPIFSAEPQPQTTTPSGNPLRLSAKEHVVLPQEGWFAISRKYNVTIEDLKRLNPNIEDLQPGMVLVVGNGATEKVVDVEGTLFKYYLVEPKETIFSLTQRFGVSRDSLVTLNPALADGLKAGMVLKVPNLEVDVPGEYSEEGIVNLERSITNYDTKNLVLMLPFNLDKIVTTDSTTNAQERIRRDKVMQISLDFYSGVLMAVDSAKAMGVSTNLTVYDSQGTREKVNSIIFTNNFDNVDVVIGPLLQSAVEAAASSLERKNIPVISPLTKKQSGTMANFLQARPTDEMLSNAMISYISERADGKNIIIIADDAAAAKKRQLLAAFPSARVVNPREGSYVQQADVASALDKNRPNYVILEATKIGILSNATSYLNSLADSHDITLFTTERNSSYDSDNISNRHLGKLKFHYPSVDKEFSHDKHISFISNYEEKYGVIPNIYAVRGFDVTYDILLRLASADDLYASLAGKGTTQYVENKFDYESRGNGGFQNKAVYIMAYDQDLNLKPVR